jgi:TPR repeat protein
LHGQGPVTRGRVSCWVRDTLLGAPGIVTIAEALRWFRQAAEAGLAEAQYNLGIMYASGRGVSLSFSRAPLGDAEAAAQGVVEVQFNLGTLYATGSGVTKDLLQAVKWLTLASESGSAEAQYNLGALNEVAESLALDEKTAVR